MLSAVRFPDFFFTFTFPFPPTISQLLYIARAKDERKKNKTRKKKSYLEKKTDAIAMQIQYFDQKGGAHESGQF